MMDPQQIKAALINKGVLLRELPQWANTTTILTDAAAEYADLLETSQRVWWCDYPEFADIACLTGHEPWKARQPNKHSDCGWLLTVEQEWFCFDLGTSRNPTEVCTEWHLPPQCGWRLLTPTQGK